MNLGLYLSVYLTNDEAWRSVGSKPRYPRCTSIISSLEKGRVLKLQLQSLKSLPFNKIFISVDCDPEFSSDVDDIKSNIYTYFPDSDIIFENRRCTTIVNWVQSTKVCEEFFGIHCPVIWMYNHDHIFVDYRLEPLIETIRITLEVERQTGNPTFLLYSHIPEFMALNYNPAAHNRRLQHLFGESRLFEDKTHHVGQGVFFNRRSSTIDGLFVTTAKSHSWLWKNANWKGDINKEYVPRPDWVGLVYPGIVFQLLSASREFFRHFDGYGHCMNSRNSLTMGLNDSDNFKERISIHKPLYMQSIDTFSNGIDLIHVAKSYREIFYDIMPLAIRDQIMMGYLGCQREKINFTLERLYNIFKISHLDTQGELSFLDSEQTQKLDYILRHLIFSDCHHYLQEIIADANLWI